MFLSVIRYHWQEFNMLFFAVIISAVSVVVAFQQQFCELRNLLVNFVFG